MTKQRLIDNPRRLMWLSGILSAATIASHCLVLAGFMEHGGYRNHLWTGCVLWAMAAGAVLCGVRALWILRGRAYGRPRSCDMTKQRLIDNPRRLMWLSGVLSAATIASHCLVLAAFMERGGYRDHLWMGCVLWAMAAGAVLCGVRALWVLLGQPRGNRRVTLLRSTVALLLVGLGALLTLGESFILYMNTLPER